MEMNISGTVRSIANGGVYQVELSVQLPDEASSLLAVFGSLIAKLEKRFDEEFGEGQ